MVFLIFLGIGREDSDSQGCPAGEHQGLGVQGSSGEAKEQLCLRMKGDLMSPALSVQSSWLLFFIWQKEPLVKLSCGDQTSPSKLSCSPRTSRGWAKSLLPLQLGLLIAAEGVFYAVSSVSPGAPRAVSERLLPHRSPPMSAPTPPGFAATWFAPGGAGSL